MAKSQKLLTSGQVKQLTDIASSEAEHQKHAIALLELHNGATHAAAAEKSGLTTHQVQYWLKKFRTQGLAAFPTNEAPTVINNEQAEKTPKKDKKSKKVKKDKDKKKSKDAKKKDKKENASDKDKKSKKAKKEDKNKKKSK